MNVYTISSVSVDQDGYTTVSLLNSAGNYGGVLTNDPQAKHYHPLSGVKVGDTIEL